MKKLIFILFLLMSMSSWSQDSTVVTTTQAERIIDKYSGKISDTFNEGIKKITPMAEKGFDVVVRFEIAKGIGLLLPLPICITFVFIIISTRRKAKFNDVGDPTNGWGILLIITWVIASVSFIVSIFSVYSGILHLMAPEWYAIKEILEIFKK